MAKILGVGIATLDIINQVDDYPGENAEVRANSQRFCRGGNVTNTLTVLSQFNNQCSWSGVLCDDYDAQYILDDLTRSKIDYSHCQSQSSGKMPTSYILSNSINGSRTIVHYRDLPELSFEHFKKLNLTNFDWIHFEGRAINETKKMLTWCKKKYPKIPISVEIEKQREDIESIFNLANVYLYAKAFSVQNDCNDAESFLQKERLKSPEADLICAWGEKGAYALIGNTKLQSKAYPPEKLVDTLGAGDTFNAGIIQARLNNLDWMDSLDFANRLAGKKCGQIGFENLLCNI
ncbi:MAG: PfkB family carbohydrate kinase [Gammaproteobacteria bacterium]|nr:PfkB family carbohydrate kinase [Gammaproteobacteria bacterium]